MASPARAHGAEKVNERDRSDDGKVFEHITLLKINDQ
jgi:hypothetical protein